MEDPADLQRLLKGAGVLEFRILARIANEMSSETVLVTADPGRRRLVGRPAVACAEANSEQAQGADGGRTRIEERDSATHATNDTREPAK